MMHILVMHLRHVTALQHIVAGWSTVLPGNLEDKHTEMGISMERHHAKLLKGHLCSPLTSYILLACRQSVSSWSV